MQINKCFYCMEDMQPGQIACPRCGRRPGEKRQPEYALPCGTILHGKYLIGAVMGEGGFGITYIGYDLLLRAKVAIKEYFPNKMANRSFGGKVVWSTNGIPKEQGCENFLKEARNMAVLRDIPEVVRVQDMPEENNTAYIVMDFIEGVTLKDKLKQDGIMPCETAVELLKPAMRAMGEVHAHGIIHRDISPDNIMLDRKGNIRLLDLGAAKEVDLRTEEGVQSSQLIHKDGFSPPEQYARGGEIGAWTDIYAMCATLCYCITGKVIPPAMDRIMYHAAVEFPDSVPQKLQQVLLKGLSIEPKQRYRSMEELLTALEKALPFGQDRKSVSKPKPASKTQPVPKTESEPGPRPEKPRNGKIMLAAAAAVLAIIIGVFIFTSGNKSGTAAVSETPEAAEAASGSTSTPENIVASGIYGDNLTWTLDNAGTLTIGGTGQVDLESSERERIAPDIYSIVIEDGVTSIGNYAFEGFSSLTSITIPTSMASIYSCAFKDCTSLKDVYYTGTQNQWNEIHLNSNNDDLTNAAIHCSDGVIAATTPTPAPTPAPTPTPTPTPTPAPTPTPTPTQTHKSGLYTPGTYTASAQGIGRVTVTMTFSKDEITDVIVDVSNETPTIGGKCGDELAEQILTAQSAEIDGVSGASMTSSAARTAAADCIAQAKGASASTQTSESGLYIPGTYTASAPGISSQVTVTMTFSEDKITDVVVDSSGETQSIGAAAQDKLAEQIMTAQSAEIDGVSGASVTSSAARTAAEKCIAQAKNG